MGRTSLHGMSSRTVLAGDQVQRSTSSLMRIGGRSRPVARQTSSRRVPESGSCSIGPRIRLRPMCRSRSCSVRSQFCRAATNVSTGMSTTRRKAKLTAAMLPASPTRVVPICRLPSRSLLDLVDVVRDQAVGVMGGFPSGRRNCRNDRRQARPASTSGSLPGLAPGVPKLASGMPSLALRYPFGPPRGPLLPGVGTPIVRSSATGRPVAGRGIDPRSPPQLRWRL